MNIIVNPYTRHNNCCIYLLCHVINGYYLIISSIIVQCLLILLLLPVIIIIVLMALVLYKHSQYTSFHTLYCFFMHLFLSCAVVIVDPGIKEEHGYPAWDNGVKQDVFLKDKSGNIFIGKVWPGPTAFADFLNSKAAGYWQEEVRDDTHMHARTHKAHSPHMHACTHAHTHAYTHTHAHMDTHTCQCVCSPYLTPILLPLHPRLVTSCSSSQLTGYGST